MKRSVCLVAVSILFLLVRPSSAAPADALVGCYTTTAGGNAHIRVQKRTGTFYLAIGTNWRDEGVGHEPTPAEVRKVFAEQSRFYLSGLYAGGFGIFKVRPGMVLHNKTVSGSYVALVLVDAGEVWRVPCP